RPLRGEREGAPAPRRALHERGARGRGADPDRGRRPSARGGSREHGRARRRRLQAPRQEGRGARRDRCGHARGRLARAASQAVSRAASRRSSGGGRESRRSLRWSVIGRRWFRRRRVGRGWRPVSWEGWLTTAVAVALVIGVFALMHGSAARVPIVILVLAA